MASAPRPGFEQCDFHTHTELSGEAQSKGFTLEKLFRTADELGLRYVGYSEHWHLGTPAELFLDIREEVERLQPHFAVKVFVSAEIDVLNSRGELSCDIIKAQSLLDYLSVAISHYDVPGAEQLLPDRIEDTVRMIEAVCAIPEVTMLMHPQIVYGRSLEHISEAVPEDAYAHVMRCIATHGQVVDYPSLRMNQDWLRALGYGQASLGVAQKSFERFTRQLVEEQVRLAPGSDAHHIFWHDGSTRWFGNNADSHALLQAYGYRDEQLWYYENRDPQDADA
jgi:histidinol phosphatase-like PHP family hydrolase